MFTHPVNDPNHPELDDSETKKHQKLFGWSCFILTIKIVSHFVHDNPELDDSETT